MNSSPADVKELIGRIVEQLSVNPIGAWTGTEDEKTIEKSYLRMLQATYTRTVSDIVRYFRESGRQPAEIQVIEFGLYLGVVSRALAELGFQVTGSDFPPLLNSPRLRDSFSGTRINLHTQDLSSRMHSLGDGRFDCVIICETLEHLNFNPVPVLDEINRILKPGGLLYLAVPNVANLRNRVFLLLGRSIHNPIADFFEQAKPNSPMVVGLHWREYTKAEVETLLSGLGFAIHSSGYFDFLGPARKSQTYRMAKKGLLSFFPALSASVVVMGKKVARSDPQTAANVGKGTLEVARGG